MPEVLFYASFLKKKRKNSKILQELSSVVGSSWMNIKIDMQSDVVWTKHLLFFLGSALCISIISWCTRV